MRKRRELTEKEIHEIKVYVFRRKEMCIKVPQIALITGISKSHLFAVECFKYRMSESVKNAYDRCINLIKNEAKKRVKYEKRSEK